MAILSKPLNFTASPTRLLLDDVLLFLKLAFSFPPTAGLPSIVIPFWPLRSGPLDELYPSVPNLWAIFLHTVMIFAQLGFLLSLIPSAFIGIPIPFYTPLYIGSIVGFVVFNGWFSVLLNGWGRQTFDSKVDSGSWDAHDDEKWVFINGVAAGQTWLQSNLDRLALTFRRPIHGIHNQTRGIIFDVLECIVQRSLGYDTTDIRQGYSEIVKILSNDQFKKVILIVHSQGAIEGGMILDWLYITVPPEQLSRLEIYTFGNAANHWNCPIKSVLNVEGQRVDGDTQPEQRVIKHIEHYANTGDFVSRWGVLYFRPDPPATGFGLLEKNGKTEQIADEIFMSQTETDGGENRFVGRLFKRDASGHQMNGNYLDNIFQMDEHLLAVNDHNVFMDGYVDMALFGASDIVSVLSPDKLPNLRRQQSVATVSDLSRLWKYRNGGSPSH